MSKKGIALLLAAVMAFACTSALAATDVVIDTGLSEFDVHFTADMDVEINSLAGDNLWRCGKPIAGSNGLAGHHHG